MNEDRERKINLLKNLLKYPGETPDADYKSSKEFIENSNFSLSLVKHILGMANAGGGYLVIGFKESKTKQPVPDNKLTQEVAASYETTRLSQFVDKHILGADKIHLVVWKVPYKGKDYPTIEVRDFNRRPYFCKSSKKGILQEGALYYRSKGNRSVALANPNDWEELVSLSVKRAQDEFLLRFKNLLEQAGLLDKRPVSKGGRKDRTFISVKKSKEPASLWVSKNRKEVEKLMVDNGFAPEYMEIAHWLPRLLHKQKWGHKELLDAAEKAMLRNTGWPIGLVIHNPKLKPKAVEEGVKAVMVEQRYTKGFDFWHIRFDGAYYFARNFREDTIGKLKNKRILYFDIRIWRIAEAIDHTVKLYKALGLEPTQVVTLKIAHKGLKDRILSASNPARAMTMFHERRSNADNVTWEIKTTLDDLFVKRRQHIESAVRKIMIMFDFFEPNHKVTESILEEYEKSRL